MRTPVPRSARYKMILAVFAAVLVLQITWAQSEWKNWDAVSLNLGLTKKMEVGVSHLRSYTVSDAFKNTFNQYSMHLGYDLTKKISVKAGFTSTYFPQQTISTNRYSLRASYKMRVTEKFNWQNGLQGEIHTGDRHYNYRLIYMTRLSLSRRLQFLKLSPSVSYWLYYNAGGNAIQYFDESGSPLVKETPDGLHRGRLILNLNTKLNKNLSLSLYYLNQHEFNLAGNDVNVVNPVTGKIVRPFKNYQVAGITAAVSFDLYKKHSKHKKESNNKHKSAPKKTNKNSVYEPEN